MRWVGAFFVGLLVGVTAAFALLYFNPLSRQAHAQAESTALLDYEFGPSTLALTHGDQLGFDLQPQNIQVLWESTIRRSMLGMFVLENLQGSPVGIASRALKLSSRSNALIRGLVVDDYWLVTIPGAGNYFIESQENIWPLVRDTVVDVNLLKRTWRGVQRYELSIGPNSDGTAKVTGTSGRFAGTAGTVVHSLELSRYEHVSQQQSPAYGQLRVNLRRSEQPDATTP
ncbi:MAG: hypothetical protein PVG24_13970 [Gammaproteobacteria bacterium]|jgi:hypothetical protein